jgi:hypothetical protein
VAGGGVGRLSPLGRSTRFSRRLLTARAERPLING